MFTSVAVKLPLLSRLGLPLQQHRNLAFVILFLTSSSTLGRVSADDSSVHSNNVIKDTDGNDVGPSITLSNTVLETNQELSYKCIKNNDFANNELTRRNPDGTEVSFANPRPATCSIHEVFFFCTILEGTIRWSRDKGGKYYCSAVPENWYYIHWINPDSVTSSGDKDLSSQSYGGSVVVKCGMDITPTTISYEGILDVKWKYVGSASGSSLTNLAESSTVSWGLEPRGPNSSLTITDFNPIKHGGEYYCFGKMLRYSKTLLGPRFKIWGKPSAKLKNNKRREFRFGKYESNVKFTCEGLSYPFPEKIEFRLQANVVNEHTKGVTHYEVDRVNVNVERHTATFTVANMSEVFTNGSLLDCTVWRREGDLEVTSQRRVILEEEDPPIDVTTPEGEITLPPHVSTRKEPTKPWVIAISIIIPIVIILIIIILLVWKRKICKMDESGDYRIGHHYDPDA